jgi:acyl-coenzyme A thioesterase PaaI-like protein
MSVPGAPEPDLAALIARARDTGDLEPITEAIPYARFMGIHVRPEGDGLTTCMRFDRHLIGNPGLPALHGGTIGALLEHAAIFQLLWDRDVLPLPKTINLTVEYLRSGRPQDTFARARITKRGRRVANVLVTAWQDGPDKPIAVGHAHFLLRNPP